MKKKCDFCHNGPDPYIELEVCAGCGQYFCDGCGGWCHAPGDVDHGDNFCLGCQDDPADEEERAIRDPEDVDQ